MPIQAIRERLRDVHVELAVELGRRRIGLRDLADRLGGGSLIHLDKPAGEAIDIYVNGRLVARGEAVVVGQRYGVRIAEILPPEPEPRFEVAAVPPGGAGLPADEVAAAFPSANPASAAPALATPAIDPADEAAAASAPVAAVRAAWNRACAIEISEVLSGRNADEAAGEFRDRFASEAQLPANVEVRWYADDAIAAVGPLGDPATHALLVRPQAMPADAALFKHLFDGPGAPRARRVVEPARVDSSVMAEVDGDVYALFPEQIIRGKTA